MALVYCLFCLRLGLWPPWSSLLRRGLRLFLQNAVPLPIEGAQLEGKAHVRLGHQGCVVRVRGLGLVFVSKDLGSLEDLELRQAFGSLLVRKLLELKGDALRLEQLRQQVLDRGKGHIRQDRAVDQPVVLGSLLRLHPASWKLDRAKATALELREGIKDVLDDPVLLHGYLYHLVIGDGRGLYLAHLGRGLVGLFLLFLV